MKAVCISDTHGLHNELIVPNGTFLIHTGDFTNRGTEAEVDNFLTWFAEQPHKHKIFIAGNHDFFAYYKSDELRQKCLLLGLIYLEDSYITLEGIKFYGTPWVPRFFDWAFMGSEEKLKGVYNRIQPDTQVLLTHGPALWTLDKVSRGHVGSHSLAKRLEELPQLTHHIFGHIHESRGKFRGNYLSVNATCIDKWYNTLPPQSIYIKPNIS